MNFITEKKVLKLISKNKVEIISSWEDVIRWGSGSMKHPAIVRLVYYRPPRPKKKRWSRQALFKRDKNQCQYCAHKDSPSRLTIDHVKPKSAGGKNTWENTVVSCKSCNSKKDNKTLKQAGMKLISGKPPRAPWASMLNEMECLSRQHESWKDYILY